MKLFIKAEAIVSHGSIWNGMGVVAQDGVILGIAESCPADAKAVEAEGKYLAPALIDLHCHGGGGYEFIDGTRESVLGALNVHANGGTGILYPTISAADYDTTYKALEALEAFGNEGAVLVPGVHLEGPYLSPEMCGAQDPGIVRKPDPEEYRALYERFGSLIARWDYAPEEDEGQSFVRFLKEKSIVSSTAHSAAQYKHLKPAMEWGNRLVTHLYSCTSTVVREGGFRKLGVIESAFLEEGMFVETIGDGCHLPPELLRMIFRIKGADRICLVTDAIRFAGLEKGAFTGKIPYVIEDGVAKLADRSAFAGSIATVTQLVQKTVEAGIPLPHVITMLTSTPAQVMGLSDYGSIEKGKKARFTVLDEKLNAKPFVPEFV